MKSIASILCLCCLLFSCSQDNQQAVDNLQARVLELEKEQTEFMKISEGSTLMHTVYFWLNDELTASQESAFVAGCQSLVKIVSVSRFRMGKPAATEERGVVDNSYSYALNVEFKDKAAHDAYQIDPIHLKFIEDHKDKWTKVVVYDNQM